jgi:hypothetical protein
MRSHICAAKCGRIYEKNHRHGCTVITALHFLLPVLWSIGPLALAGWWLCHLEEWEQIGRIYGHDHPEITGKRYRARLIAGVLTIALFIVLNATSTMHW